MPVINPTLPNDGETIDASDVNNPFNAILTVLNGNIDDTNIAGSANINGTKLLNNSVSLIKLDANSRANWLAGIVPVPTSISYLGQRSYQLTFNGVNLTTYLSNGMRLLLQRTLAAPTQCISLNGTTQFFNRTAVAGMTFTNNFVVSAWVKLTSYGGNPAIISRYNGTNGFSFQLTPSGQLVLYGFNGAVGNNFSVTSYQSIPLNKWVHVAAQMDMTSTVTTGNTANYMMIHGIEIPSLASRLGTNPTALVQAGNLEIGSNNGGINNFPGKIAQAAIYSAKVTEATIMASANQTLVGTETSLISAYSFNNSIVDLNAGNANNLTANNGAVATNTDSPFAQGATAGMLEFGIITTNSFSANTVLTVQVPEGSMIPTSGGLAAVSYSTSGIPYGFPGVKTKWEIIAYHKALLVNTGNNAKAAWYKWANSDFTVPAGDFDIYWAGTCVSLNGSAGASVFAVQLDTGIPSATGNYRKNSVTFETKYTGDPNFPNNGTSPIEQVSNTIASIMALYGITLVGGGANSTMQFDSGFPFIACIPTYL